MNGEEAVGNSAAHDAISSRQFALIKKGPLFGSQWQGLVWSSGKVRNMRNDGSAVRIFSAEIGRAHV